MFGRNPDAIALPVVTLGLGLLYGGADVTARAFQRLADPQRRLDQRLEEAGQRLEDRIQRVLERLEEKIHRRAVPVSNPLQRVWE